MAVFWQDLSCLSTPVGTHAHSPPAFDYVAAFKAKLLLHRIKTPDKGAMSRLLWYYPQQMMMMAQPAAPPASAILLYKQALAQPGTQTMQRMLADLNVAVNGQQHSSHPELLTAVDLESSELVILKLLPPLSKEQKHVAKAEHDAIKILQLSNLSPHSALVKSSLVTVPVSKEHAAALEIGQGQYMAVKMPRFLSSLSQLPQLSEAIIYKGALRLESALQEMHAVSLLHADIKSDNVVLNVADMWHLADYGSCVAFGQPIQSCTQAWYPGTIWGQQAAAKYDWGLLVVLIAVELGKRCIEDLTGGTEPIKVQLALVLERCRAVQLSGLKQLLETFIGRAGWL